MKYNLKPFIKVKTIHSQKENHSTLCVSSLLQRSKQRTRYSVKSAALATVLIHTSSKAKLQDKLGCNVLVTLETHG